MKKAYVIIVFLFLNLFVLGLLFLKIHSLNSDYEKILIEKTKEIINEKNYFLSDNDESFIIGDDICYDIYSDDSDYFVVLPEENIHFSFSKFEYNFYYTGYEDYKNAAKTCSGSFSIENIYIPDYNKDNNTRITCSLDYETILSSVISNYDCDDFYTVYLLNKFPWDKSEFMNGSELINIMIIDSNKNVFKTYCYFSADGWLIGTPGYVFSQNEYPELVEKYKNTSVYSKHNININ